MSNPGRSRLVIVFVCLGLFILAILTAPLFHTRHTDYVSSCASRLHQLGLAMGSYMQDHEDRYPDPNKWPMQTLQYVKTQGIYRCPSANYGAVMKYRATSGEWEGELMVSYAMNERLRGLSVKDVKKPEETVLLFDSNDDKLFGGPELLPKGAPHEETRYLVIHDRYINVLFADRHVNKIPLDEVPKLKWDPR